MRISQEMLQKIARDTVKSRQRSEPDIMAAYLVGSVLTNEPLLGGTTDIDLVLVHKYQAMIEREVVPVTREVSLDIIHKRKDDFDQYRELRHDPWLGYPLTYNHILLLDTDHWLEFIQSGVTAGFHRSDNVLIRVRGMLDSARQGWFALNKNDFPDHIAWLQQYLAILTLAANAVTGLIGPPLTTRRFILDFSAQVETLGVPNLQAGLFGLLGISKKVEKSLPKWIEALKADLLLASEIPACPVRLAPCRYAYYLDAIGAMVENGEFEAALWPLFTIWLDLREILHDANKGLKPWTDFLLTLQLVEEHQSQKTMALDSYLDTVEQVIEDWVDIYGD